MNIAVLVKQTPQVSEVTISDKAEWPESGTIINPFDEYAIEEGLRIREKLGGKVVALSYGIDKAESALRDALALGVDEAVLITDQSYSYLDPQRAALGLSKAIARLGDIQMVLTGKQATDDDSALMAPSVAAYLDWPQVGFIKKFESVTPDKIICYRTTDYGYDKVEVPLPAVFSVVKEINEPRLPSLKGKMKAKKAPIARMTAAELRLNNGGFVIQKGISSPPSRPSGEILSGEKGEIIDKLIARLKENQIL